MGVLYTGWAAGYFRVLDGTVGQSVQGSLQFSQQVREHVPKKDKRKKNPLKP